MSEELPPKDQAQTPETPALAVPTVPTVAKPAPAAALKPALTPAAAAKISGAPASAERRQFVFSWLTLAWAAFAAATAAALSTTGRFLFPNVLFEPKTWFKAGKPDDYEIGAVDLRWQDKYGTWIVRNKESIYALSTICTHLGCTPSWLEAEQKFKCPCHGSGYYKSGVNFEGPAPRPLERFRITLADDGQILVDKSKKFQEEKGEWTQPESFLTV
ncbi:MAG: ubiquinol-cytochrome c reductase iron-sulfur subunit [Candidatus Omnitrophica bacterium]|nr:ubiquinol-cytochrome c reductase iron-sulfur subunit [Candidatus Omnitrophota bacterium]